MACLKKRLSKLCCWFYRSKVTDKSPESTNTENFENPSPVAGILTSRSTIQGTGSNIFSFFKKLKNTTPNVSFIDNSERARIALRRKRTTPKTSKLEHKAVTQIRKEISSGYHGNLRHKTVEQGVFSGPSRKLLPATVQTNETQGNVLREEKQSETITLTRYENEAFGHLRESWCQEITSLQSIITQFIDSPMRLYASMYIVFPQLSHWTSRKFPRLAFRIV